MIFNCSERTYDKTKLEGRVIDFNWKDHHAPPLHLLCDFVDKMLVYLKGSLDTHLNHVENDQHVVVVHCNSGKGRTGTGIACLLMLTGLVDNIDDALRYYGWKRFSSGIGVSQPC